MKPELPSIKPTTAGLRQLLKERGVSVESLAQGCGLKPQTVLWQMNAATPSPRTTWKIERFLGAPIWTGQARFADLTRASEFLGADFVLTKFHPLRSAAAQRGIRNTSVITTKDALLARVLAHLAENQTHAST